MKVCLEPEVLARLVSEDDFMSAVTPRESTLGAAGQLTIQATEPYTYSFFFIIFSLFTYNGAHDSVPATKS